jgi:hypothetical protein
LAQGPRIEYLGMTAKKQIKSLKKWPIKARKLENGLGKSPAKKKPKKPTEKPSTRRSSREGFGKRS